MRKNIAVLLILFLALPTVFASGCTGDVNIPDGTYRAEFADYDALGYKDFVEVVIQDNKVIDVFANAQSGLDGSYKLQNESLRAQMEGISNTYPEKFYTDLANQYLSNPKASEIEIVAGATESSNNFIILLKALEKALKAGTYPEPCLIVPR